MNAPNIVVVVMDTARAKSVSAHENPGVMPNVERIAADGITYENAITTAPWTLPSHASLFSGQYTTDHGAHAGTKRFDPEYEPLPSRLQRAGYRTVGISNNSWVTPEFGFGRGFGDFYMGSEPLAGGVDLVNVIKNHETRREQFRTIAGKLTARNTLPTLVNAFYARYLQHRYDDGARLSMWRAKRWLDHERSADRPFFMFVNCVEPHLKYRPPSAFYTRYLPDGVSKAEASAVNQDAWEYMSGVTEMDERDFEILEGLYNAELAYLDGRIGELYDAIESRDLLEDTLFVVTSDHGENIGDHGLMDHQYCLYDTLIRVPLVIRPPAGVSGGRVESSVVELRDLFPTVLAAADIDGPTAEELDGGVSDRRLPGLFDEGEPRRREYAISEYVTPQPTIQSLSTHVGVPEADLARFDRGLRCVRTTRWKYVQSSDGDEALFDVRRDPGESNDLIDERPERARELESVLETRRGSLRRGDQDGTGTTEMKATTKQRLEDLGYI